MEKAQIENQLSVILSKLGQLDSEIRDKESDLSTLKALRVKLESRADSLTTQLQSSLKAELSLVDSERRRNNHEEI